MGMKKFVWVITFVLLGACGKNKHSATPTGGAPGEKPPSEAPKKSDPVIPSPPVVPVVVDDTRLACLHVFETTNPELAKQVFTFEADGSCRYSHSAYPNISYACSYTVVNHAEAKVLLVPGTTEGWAFRTRFSEDCQTLEPDGFGLNFQRHP